MPWVFRALRSLLPAALLWLALAGTAGAEPPAPTVIVVDSSGSMSATLDGEPRLDTARKVLAELLAGWQAEAPLGLIAYGHRRGGDCADIEVLAPIGPPDPAALAARLAGLRARGKTPLAASLQAAAGLLAERGKGGNVILITDGLETCHADPCAVAAALRAADATLSIHVIGFAVEAKDEEQLACIATAGGGLYRTAGDAETLLASLGETAGAAAAPVASAPAPAPAPEPNEPEPAQSVLVAFKAVVAGEGPLVELPVAWSLLGEAGPEPYRYEGESRALALELPPGRYGVEARASNAVGRATIEVSGKETQQEVEVTLPAGRLSARAVAYAGAAPLDEGAGLRWSLEPLQGQPPVAMPAVAQPALLLAAGRYRLVAEQGGRRAEAEVTVAPGQPAVVEVSFRLGELQLSAALAEAAEPLTDWHGLAWRALAPDGTLAAEVRNAATASFLLPAGRYSIELAIAGTTLSRTLEVAEGQRRQERFVVATGSRTLTAALAPGGETLDDWRDTYWTVTAIDALGIAPGTLLLESQPVANPTLALLPGRWAVAVVSGQATAGREIQVAPDSDETLRLDLQAARLTIVAAPAAGAPPAANVVFAVAPYAGDGSLGVPMGLGGSQDSLSSILPVGRWRLFATDEQNRHAEADVDLTGGEERQVTLQLE